MEILLMLVKKSNNESKKEDSKMKNVIYGIAFCFLLFSSCNAQNKKNESENKSNIETEVIKPEPKIDIQVNKKYDESGSQIGFDSTYTSFYSNIEGDTLLMDSLFNQFNPFLKNNYDGVFDRQFENLFFNDSLFYDDFFHTDFFRKRYEMNNEYFKRVMNEMDSVKNEFYQKQKEVWSETKDFKNDP